MKMLKKILHDLLRLFKKKPKYLFKYRNFDVAGYNFRLISFNELYFSSADKFNDPFDCNIPFSLGDGKEADVKRFLRNGIALDDPTLSPPRS